MPVQVVTEESDRVVPALQETKETMTKKENEKWLRRYERNMCPADLYDDITYGLEDLVAPI